MKTTALIELTSNEILRAVGNYLQKTKKELCSGYESIRCADMPTSLKFELFNEKVGERKEIPLGKDESSYPKRLIRIEGESDDKTKGSE